MRRDGLSSPLAPDERIGEPNNDVVRCAGEFADSMRAARHNRRIIKYPNPHIVDIETVNLVDAFLEHIGEDAGSVAGAAIWPGASPLGGNDLLDGGSVARHPGLDRSCWIRARTASSRSGPGTLICCVSKGGRDHERHETCRPHEDPSTKSPPGHRYRL